MSDRSSGIRDEKNADTAVAPSHAATSLLSYRTVRPDLAARTQKLCSKESAWTTVHDKATIKHKSLAACTTAREDARDRHVQIICFVDEMQTIQAGNKSYSEKGCSKKLRLSQRTQRAGLGVLREMISDPDMRRCTEHCPTIKTQTNGVATLRPEL